MRNDTHPASAANGPQPSGRAISPRFHEIQQQCIRVLRCTASAMASSPGGLRFKAGTRPWLEGLSASKAGPATAASRGGARAAYAAVD